MRRIDGAVHADPLGVGESTRPEGAIGEQIPMDRGNKDELALDRVEILDPLARCAWRLVGRSVRVSRAANDFEKLAGLNPRQDLRVEAVPKLPKAHSLERRHHD